MFSKLQDPHMFEAICSAIIHFCFNYPFAFLTYAIPFIDVLIPFYSSSEDTTLETLHTCLYEMVTRIKDVGNSY